MKLIISWKYENIKLPTTRTPMGANNEITDYKKSLSKT